MKDVCLVIAGGGGILVALMHGYLGQTVVLRQITGVNRTLARVNAAVFQLSTFYWLAVGALLIATPFWLAPAQRPLVIWGAVLVYLSAALANAWATGGRHPGWALLAVVSAFALAGL